MTTNPNNDWSERLGSRFHVNFDHRWKCFKQNANEDRNTLCNVDRVAEFASTWPQYLRLHDFQDEMMWRWLKYEPLLETIKRLELPFLSLHPIRSVGLSYAYSSWGCPLNNSCIMLLDHWVVGSFEIGKLQDSFINIDFEYSRFYCFKLFL